MSEPYVQIFGGKPKTGEVDPDTKKLMLWAKRGGVPNKHTAQILRRHLIELEQWRQQVIASIQKASELLQSQQHGDGLDIPTRRTEEFQAGRAAGIYEGYGAANRILADIVNAGVK